MMPPDTAALLGDGQRLTEILALAGPRTAPLILQQMQIDLASVASALAGALDQPDHAAPDWAALRAQTHVLISLAGTIGADRLHRLAIDLNAAAHDRTEAQAAALAAPLLSDLARLRRALADWPAVPPGAPPSAPPSTPAQPAPQRRPDDALP